MRIRIASIAGLVLALSNLPAAADTLSDPTRPMSFSAAGASPGSVEPLGPVLQSTVVSPLRRSAVISGRTVKLGDSIDGAIVVDIQPYEVRLRRGQRETTLRMLPKLVKEQR